mmetsp:Transcript_17972/g.35043  ORF Transcript_17972/g.35043 Transcript_17972/m.35043 type:complete len:413 (-) Transcript_17972:217-1455(-)
MAATSDAADGAHATGSAQQVEGGKQLQASDLEACSISRWYPQLRHASIRTQLLPLSPLVLGFLRSDSSLCLPDVFGDESGDGSDVDSVEESADDEAGSSLTAAEHEALASLCTSIMSAISKLGGEVFVKLNWSAPTDAAWVLGGSLKCTSAHDVMLLLKSSDRTAHDLCEAHKLCAPTSSSETSNPSPAHSWVLAVRKWSNLLPSGEFRCFRGSTGELLAACQRDRSSHFPFLADQKESVLQLLRDFQRLNLSDVAPTKLVWDAYIDQQRRVYLIDLAPFHESTDPILFGWEWLHEADAAARRRRAGHQPHTHPHTHAHTNGHTHAQSQAHTHAHIHAHTDAAQPPDTSSTAPTPPHAVLRLVEEGGLAPSARVYHGWPEELRQLQIEDLPALVATAKAAAEDTADACTGDS